MGQERSHIRLAESAAEMGQTTNKLAARQDGFVVNWSAAEMQCSGA